MIPILPGLSYGQQAKSPAPRVITPGLLLKCGDFEFRMSKDQLVCEDSSAISFHHEMKDIWAKLSMIAVITQSLFTYRISPRTVVLWLNMASPGVMLSKEFDDSIHSGGLWSIEVSGHAFVDYNLRSMETACASWIDGGVTTYRLAFLEKEDA